MPDVYGFLLDAELSKAFDVWSGYLNSRTGEDPGVRARLRDLLESARTAAAEDELVHARALVAEMYDEAEEAGLPWAPARPTAEKADRQARDYAKDDLRKVCTVQRREALDTIAIILSVTRRRFWALPDLDAATRRDIDYICARAGMALDLAHETAARRELERLESLARRLGVKP
ncbi:hypothetical protein [Streptomyces sindenensis]|uniref:hypothetical protein n=1 Tax=Streptomyces sindenensis TaxID=67363 RepID=UPI001672BAE3|nr:hypothetical protein [Streptomyces sindenensis]GGP43549.1 hypothetical protein GCM10010231_13660 [Streptomyces sindenensis]